MNSYCTINRRPTRPVAGRGRQTAALLLTLAILAPLTALAQAGRSADLETQVDPLSFRGPDPSVRFKEIKIEQKLDSQIPLDLKFRNSEGEQVTLGDYFGDKPVILALVYYECPMLCTQVLNGLTAGIDGADNTLELGKEYEVVTVSIDPGETAELARVKKSNYIAQLHRPGGEEGWHWLTGDEESIEALAQAVGFGYSYDASTDQYAHASGIMVLTPKGHVSSYYLGIEYIPKKLKFALMDAAEERIGTLVDNLVLLCYAYDPSKGAYGFYVINAVRIGGGLTVGALGLFWLLSWMHGRRKRGGAAPGVGDFGEKEQTV
ncbi:MAG: SCO family protein [Candidatus Hydrogenedentes bacterium]|nr:SCO family protein [Candidatus Hydrogenedentota bacterium]